MSRGAILVVNVGSSSIKASVFEAAESLSAIAHGQIAGIGGDTTLEWNGDVITEVPAALGHASAMKELITRIAPDLNCFSIHVVGHRIVHGGEHFTSPVLITPAVLEELEALIPLAPQHQSVSLEVVREIAEHQPGWKQIACFDTAFHAHHAAVYRSFALPEYLRSQGVRRYGFHGLSYEWIARVLATEHPSLASGRVVAAHLGNGASLCALRNAKSIDTTMGMTVLDGLPMGTRCGAIDPGVILYLFRHLQLDIDRIEHILLSESGLLGLSGISHDMRDLLASDSEDAALAVDYFCAMTAQHVARMVTALGGIDALVFTGGIGEHAEPVRDQIVASLDFLAPFQTFVIPANEERVIAEHCWRTLTQCG